MAVKHLSLRQSLALWTLVPMVTFSLIVLTLSFGWAWRDVLSVAEVRDADLVRLAAQSLGECLERECLVNAETVDTDAFCRKLSDLSAQIQGDLFVTDLDGMVVCAPSQARFAVGDRVSYPVAGTALSFSSSRYFASFAPISHSSYGVLLEEPRAQLFAPTYSFLVAISALMIAGLFILFALLLIGFYRISSPLVAVTEQAKRVAEGREFSPPDETGPAEVEALVAAFNHMVTLLRRQRDALHDYAIRMLRSQEEERKRISRDLHDETSQELVGLMQRIDLCRLAAEDDAQILAALDELAELADHTLSGVRRMSRALRPLILEDLGLVAAVQTIAEELDQQLPKASVFCEVIGDDQRLAPEVELTAFRVVQEALTNVRKHAVGADRVYVTIQFKPDRLQISVEDNGHGFHLSSYELRPNSDHLGLIGMKERAELLDGRLDITSRPGEGTQVTLDLPVSAPVDGTRAAT